MTTMSEEKKSTSAQSSVEPSRGRDGQAVDADLEDIHIEDEAGSVAAKALQRGEAVSSDMSNRVLKKLDTYILPFLCVTYGLQLMDKSTLQYSSVYGLIPDNHLIGQDYSWASSIFYFGYLLAEYPGVAILQRFPIAKFLGVNIIVWGAVLMTTAACSSFAGLATVRFILGVTEATVSPGFVVITSIWWTRQEQASRSGVWVSFVGVGGAVGSLLAFAIGHVQGSLAQWRLIFLVLGATTVLWGVVFILFMPDGPAQVRWLNEEEKVVAVQRVIGNKMGTKSRRFVRAQVVEAVMDPKIVVLGLISFAVAIGAGSLSFGSLIIAGFGFGPLETTLMNLPFTAVQTAAVLLGGLVTSRVENARLHVSSIAAIPAIVGAFLISRLPVGNKWGRVAGYWMLGSHAAAFAAVMGLLSANVAGSTKRSVASGWVFVCYCVGQIAAPLFFRSEEAPVYQGGIAGMLSSFLLTVIFNQLLRYLYLRENRRRERELRGKTDDELAQLVRQSDLQGFEDVTDKANVMFRYAL